MPDIMISKKNYLFCFWLLICLFVFIEPVVFVFTKFHSIFRVAQVIISFCLLLLSIKSSNIKYITFVFIFFIYFLIVTIINNGPIIKVITMFLPILGLLLCLQYFVNKDVFLTIKTLYLYFSIIIYINFILLVSFPEGLLSVNAANAVVNYHFLGVSNQIGPYLLVAITISVIYSYFIKRLTLGVIILNICSYVTLIMISSATSLVWLTIFYILIALERSKVIRNLLSWTKVVTIIFVIHLLVVFFNLQNFFAALIINVLEKDLTLSGRTEIWRRAVELIKQSFLLGYGETHDSRYVTVGTAEFGAHNIFLQIMLQGGLILLIIFIIILIVSISKTRINRDTSLRNYVLFSIIILFSMMITEVYSYLIIFLLLFLSYITPLYKNEEFYCNKRIIFIK